MSNRKLNKERVPGERLAAEESSNVGAQQLNWPALMVEGIEEALFSVDHDWRFTYLNQHASVLLGQPREALLGNVMWEMFPSLIGTGFERLYRQAIADRMPGRLEDFSITRSGWYEVNAYPLEQGLIVHFRDISPRKQAEAEIQRQAARSQVKAEISRALAEVVHDYQANLDTAARKLVETLGDACVIRLISPDGQWFELAASYYPDPEAAAFVSDVLVGNQYQRVSEGLAGRAVQTGQPLLIPVISPAELHDMISPDHWEYLDRFTVSSVLITPLRAMGEVIGIIAMNRDAPGRSYTTDDQIVLQDLADRVAIAIANARLLQQVQDELAERASAEAALRVSEDRFRVLIEHSPDAIVLFHLDGTIVYGSPATTRVLGYTLDEFIGRNGFDLIHPDDRASVAAQLTKILDDPTVSVPVYIRIQHYDGSWRLLEGMFTNLLDNPSVGAIINNYRDITDRAQADEALRISEGRFKVLSEATNEAVFIHENGRILEVNERAFEMFGYPFDELRGMSVEELVAPEHRIELRQRITTVSRQPAEVVGLRKDGTRFIIESRGRKIEYQGKPVLLVTIRDITDLKLAEAALRASEERFTGIVASAMDAIISIDESQRIVVFNIAAEQMFRCTAAEVIGQRLEPFLPSGFRQRHAQHIRGFGQTGVTSRSMRSPGKLTAIRATGEEFPIEATISQTIAAGQRLYTVIIRDITERLRAEEAFRKTEAQLLQLQKMESMGQLAGGIAHDFNNLLTAIIGYSDIILMRVDPTDSVYTDVLEIEKAGNRASTLVRQILAFSRQQILEPQVVSLNATVAYLDKMLRRVIGEDVELVSLLDSDLPPVLVDPGQIEQVIVNLVVNARDAMPDGGQITIETALIELDEHYRSAKHTSIKAGTYVMLAVSDTGMGMDEATQARIFEPFFTTKEVGKGTGLGLATVYGIVRQSEGLSGFIASWGSARPLRSIYRSLQIIPSPLCIPSSMSSRTRCEG